MQDIVEMQKRKHTAIGSDVADAVSNEVVDVANAVNAKVIISLTESGSTARLISRYKPLQKHIAFTANPITHRQLLFTFGVTPVLIKNPKSDEEVIKNAKEYCLKNKLVLKGDKMVLCSVPSLIRRLVQTC